MTFSDITTFTYIGNTVIIDGVDREVVTTCPVDAVQYHTGRNVLEEPLMIAVPESVYQYAIDEWVTSGIVPEPTVEELAAQARVDAKAAKELALSTLTVTTTAGNTFDADDAGRASMNEAITAADILGLTENNWKLADNTVVVITLDELKEALALSIQAKGNIILGTV